MRTINKIKEVAYIALSLAGIGMVIIGILLTVAGIFDPELVQHIEDVRYNQAIFALLLGGSFLAVYGFKWAEEDTDEEFDNVA